MRGKTTHQKRSFACILATEITTNQYISKKAYVFYVCIMGEIFGFNDQFFDERIEVAMLHLEGNDSKYNKVFNKLSATLSDMYHHYYDGGKGIPEGYEERIQ